MYLSLLISDTLRNREASVPAGSRDREGSKGECLPIVTTTSG